MLDYLPTLQMYTSLVTTHEKAYHAILCRARCTTRYTARLLDNVHVDPEAFRPKSGGASAPPISTILSMPFRRPLWETCIVDPWAASNIRGSLMSDKLGLRQNRAGGTSVSAVQDSETAGG